MYQDVIFRLAVKVRKQDGTRGKCPCAIKIKSVLIGSRLHPTKKGTGTPRAATKKITLKENSKREQKSYIV